MPTRSPSTRGSQAARHLLVDGYNLLLRLVEHDTAELGPERMGHEQHRLLDLLGLWAGFRGVEVTVAWDGFAPRGSREDPVTLRVVWVCPPAEADDWIVEEAERLVRAGVAVEVATRDRGLLARLPKRAHATDLDALAADLEALTEAPLAAPELRGPDGETDVVPVGGGPIDTLRLPRRRSGALAGVAPTEPEPAPKPPAPAARPKAKAPARPKKAKAPDESARREKAAREDAAAKRDKKRAKWERAQARKKKR